MTFKDYIMEIACWVVALLLSLGVVAYVFLFWWSKDLLGLGNTVILALILPSLAIVFGLISAFLKAKLA